MSAFRTHLLGVLGSVISVSACGGAVAEQGLRDGLTEDDLCTAEGQFSRVTGISPADEQSYLEWRSSYSYDATAAQTWEETKSPIVESDLSDAEKDQELASAFEQVVWVQESSGSCAYPECDRYVLPADGAGFGRGYDGARYHLFAHGPGGPTLVGSVEQAKVFLGPIDTPHDAAWLAEAEGYRVSCEPNSYVEDETGYLLYAETGTTCGGDITGHRLHVGTDGAIDELDAKIVEEGDDGCAIGRLPSGALSSRSRAHDSHHAIGAYFADAARLEGASIVAFLELARDLRHHGAPTELGAWAERAAAEETRHAELCRALAQRYGAEVSATTIEPSPVKSLLEIALDNAVEGLGREAFGALVAHHQLLTAHDQAVRAAMRLIARDEASHAEFSIALHGWLMTKLDASERDAVTQARESAIRELRPKLCGPRAPDLRRAAGLPMPDVASRLYDELFSVDFAA